MKVLQLDLRGAAPRFSEHSRDFSEVDYLFDATFLAERISHWQSVVDLAGEDVQMSPDMPAPASVVEMVIGANRTAVIRDCHVAMVKSWAALVMTASKRQPGLLLPAADLSKAISSLSATLATIKSEGPAFDEIIAQLASALLSLLRLATAASNGPLPPKETLEATDAICSCLSPKLKQSELDQKSTSNVKLIVVESLLGSLAILVRCNETAIARATTALFPQLLRLLA
jgi:hypothetical protein